MAYRQSAGLLEAVCRNSVYLLQFSLFSYPPLLEKSRRNSHSLCPFFFFIYTCSCPMAELRGHRISCAIERNLLSWLCEWVTEVALDLRGRSSPMFYNHHQCSSPGQVLLWSTWRPLNRWQDIGPGWFSQWDAEYVLLWMKPASVQLPQSFLLVVTISDACAPWEPTI